MKTKTLPGSDVVVVTALGTRDTYCCKPMEVPVDDRGRPLFTRVETDAHGGLRILLSPTSYKQYNATAWTSVKNEEHLEPTIVQAVRNAS